MPDWSIILSNDAPPAATLLAAPAPGQPLTAGPYRVGAYTAHLEVAADTAFHDGRGLLLLLKGSLYDQTPAGVLALYERHVEDFARHLEGSFVLALLDLRLGRVWAVTDRNGSRAAYAAQEGQTLLVSTTLDRPELTRRPLSVSGLACFLGNGSLLGDLTLYGGVRSLTRASVHDLRPGGLERRAYWSLRAAPPRRKTAGLRDELAELLRAAVRRRVAAAGPRIFLSLSGGHDSRALLALLAETGRDIHCFSYASAPDERQTDADAARHLARQYGASHVTLAAYGGDLFQVLRRNAAWGQGVANFCDEADAWAELDAQQPSDIFTGEEMMGTSGPPAGSRGELLGRVHLPDTDALSGLAPALPGDTRALLTDAYAAELQALLERVPAELNTSEQEIFLCLEQLYPHRLLPWRERFAGRLAPVHTPLLDGPLMDFMQTLPVPLLSSKLLFRQTLRQTFPAILQVPLARRSGYVTDWTQELLRQRGAIRAQLEDRRSRLDDLVPPGTLQTLLDSLALPSPPSRQAALRTALRAPLGRVRRAPAVSAVLGYRPQPSPPPDRTTLLLRLLTLRELL